MDIYLYEDANGDPRDDAVHRASLTGQQIQAVDEVTWSTFILDSPVTFAGPGDILIGVVNRTTREGSFPAAIDQTDPQGRSWAGVTIGELPPDPPPIPYGETFGLVGDIVSQDGNWMIRGQNLQVDVLFQDRFQFKPGDTFRDCEPCPTMVVLPAGSFLQGSSATDPAGMNAERPQRTVNLGSFAMTQTTITFAQWDACFDAGACNDYSPDSGSLGRGQRPVVNVNWADAQAYVDWLNSQSGGGYHLPAESEWEFAARAGTLGYFNTGDCISTDQANFRGDFSFQQCPAGLFRQGPTAVASFPPNAFGLLDMHGNVREWVQDCWNENYENDPIDGSTWTGSGNCSFAPLRGGSYADSAAEVRSAYRLAGQRIARTVLNGFRVVRDLTP